MQASSGGQKFLNVFAYSFETIDRAVGTFPDITRLNLEGLKTRCELQYSFVDNGMVPLKTAHVDQNCEPTYQLHFPQASGYGPSGYA